MVPLTDEEFALLGRLVTDYSGIRLDPMFRSSLSQNLAQRIRRLGLAGFMDYYRFIKEEAAGQRELAELAETLSNKETYFFRELRHFQVLRDHALPRFLKKQTFRAREPLAFWSAGCATGEEPFSLAISLIEYQETRRLSFAVRILATDLDTAALDRARQGIFERRSLRALPALYLEKYFQKQGERWRLSDRVREMVDFRRHNLVRDGYDHPFLANMDVIFCRNVSIYFGAEVLEKVNAGLACCLRPGGYLFVGTTETVRHNLGHLNLIEIDGVFLFNKTESAADGPPETKPHPPLKLRKKKEERRRAVALPPVERQRATVREPERAPRKTTDGDVPESSYRFAVEAFEREEYELALQHLCTALQIQPSRFEIHCMLASIYIDQENFAEAEKACQRTLEIGPWKPEAHFLWGLIFRYRGQEEEAIERFRRAIYLKPSYGVAHFQLAEVYRTLGRQMEARREYENTLNILDKGYGADSICNLSGMSEGYLRDACQAHLKALAVREVRFS